MSAPAAGSSGSSSASPVPGYYPDPSVPNYIRYWNGSAWVPGTSRPAPADGGTPAASAAQSTPAAPPSPAAPSAPSVPAARSADESGVMYLDEDPGAPLADFGTGTAAAVAPPPSAPAPTPVPPPAAPAPEPAPGPSPVWPRAAGQPAASEPQRISWGTAAPARQQAAAPSVPAQPQPQPQAQPHPQPQAPAAPWAQQVHHLARQSEEERQESPAPWRPPVGDPFLSTITRQDRPAALVRRFAARVLDTALFCAVTAAAAVPLGTAAYQHIQDKVDDAEQTGETVKVWLIDGTTGVEIGAVLLVAVLAGLLLEVLPTAKWGRTLGKKLVGLRVLDVEAQLPPGFGASLRRWLTHTVLDALVVGAVGLAWCLFDRPWRQCWHDKAAGTFVAGD
ncbi:RDD family protein [Actinacidiphila alni]|uniref:RDD family protein n=1 Tax=Actinacidiphila alni TaxID=380248 RepID=UPI003456C258